MSKVSINESTLTAIGNAIRKKAGTTELIAPLDMGAAIANLPSGGGEVEPVVLTGRQDYGCAGPIASTYVKLYGNTITTKDISDADNMFYKYQNETIPFDINCKEGSTVELTSLFELANIKTVPKINNAKPSAVDRLFYNCQYLREIPDDIDSNWDWSNIENATGSFSGYANNMFGSCSSLRKIPMSLLSHMNKNINSAYAYYYSAFAHNNVLDELVGLPVPYTNTTWTNNAFGSTFISCYRLKNVIFETPNGQPVVVKWKNQTIDLSSYVGSCSSRSNMSSITTKFNSGITEAKRVYDDATYQALKNDPDWFTDYDKYSRYNHDSAVATINSLPDTSAYLVTAGGTNTIKFKGVMGEATDGGAINTLTEAEIAVAAAKGWTVTLV